MRAFFRMLVAAATLDLVTWYLRPNRWPWQRANRTRQRPEATGGA